MKEAFIKKINTYLDTYQGTYLNTKTYLVCAAFILPIFAVWFSNVGLLPFENSYDFILFVLLTLIFAIYRPGWAFLLFVGMIALENINLAPENLPIALRPYQLLAGVIMISLAFQFFVKRLSFPMPKLRWFDALPVIFAASGFASALFSPDKGASFKQSIVALSFVAIYFLVRIYVCNIDDVKKMAPFFFGGSVVVAAWAILQNVIFKLGGNSFEVMPGRPNSTFTEPDWLGIYLVFVSAAIFVLSYYVLKSNDNKSSRLFNQFKNFSIFKQILLFSAMITIFVALILTVSRSAWIGALFVAIGFLKIMLFSSHPESVEGSRAITTGFFATLRMTKLDWRKFFHALKFLAVAAILSISIVYIFGLTRFQIFNRAASTGGLQKITVACPMTACVLPEKIKSLSDLDSCNCRHINLEDIEKEKAAGNRIDEVYRPDPNVNIRAEIYGKSIEQIKENPVLGIGWGSIGNVLGKDERGVGLNASNIFLEVWLGAGIAGLLSFVILLGYIFAIGAKEFLDRKNPDKTIPAFVMLGWAAIVIPNLFNSGIFLGFVWAFLAIAVSILEGNNLNNN